MRKYYIIAFCAGLAVFVAVAIGSIDNDSSNSFGRFFSKIFSKNPAGRFKRSGNIQAAPQTNNGAPQTHTEPLNYKYIILIMDDAGVTPDTDILNFPYPLNISVLPHSRYTGLWVNKLENQSVHETLLHIPMAAYSEPSSGIQPGMNEEQIENYLNRCINSVPTFSGANHHQGSLATRDKILMQKFFSVYKNTQKYYVDSVTISGSRAYQEAVHQGVPALKRDIFIDNNTSSRYLKKQLLSALKISEKRGYAVAIAHVTTRNFLNVLTGMDNVFKKSGIRFIKISDFLKIWQNRSRVIS